MDKLSLIEKLKILMNMILSSPLFLFCILLAIALFIMYFVFTIKNKKINKWVFISSWMFLLIILMFKYSSIIFSILDDVLDRIFMALYFPSTTIYILIIVLSNTIFIYSLFSKNVDKKHTLLNFVNALLINILLIFLVDTINTNNINIYDELSMYQNSSVLVLLQFTTAIFASWLLLNLLVSAHNKLKVYDKTDSTPEIIFEEI